MKLNSLHFFYPQNDNALGRDVINYTATRAAVDLQRAGEALPIWYGHAGDFFVTQGVPWQWFSKVSADFDLRVFPWAHKSAELKPAPWGWSRASRQELQKLGFVGDLPSDDSLQKIRMLSHRRNAIRLGHATGCYRGIEACDAPTALAQIKAWGNAAVVKLPWSGSGRGVFDTMGLTDDEILRQCAGKINRQGSVIVEPLHRRLADFGLLFDMTRQGSEFVGLSVFDVDEHMAWWGNTVACDHTLSGILAAKGVDIAQLDDLIHRIFMSINHVYAGYVGPMCVDMMLTAHSGLQLAEVNLRMTMGRVAQTLAHRFLAPGLTARFLCRKPTDCQYVARDGRLVSGTVPLTPPDRRLQFVLTTNKEVSAGSAGPG